jgi:hypothetical protein
LDKFIAQHGDPLGELDAGKSVGTNRDWPALKDALHNIALAWDPPDSSRTSPRKQRL